TGADAVNCRDGYVFTAPRGTFLANTWNLSDMIGNVAEWTPDCWNDSYEGAPSDGSPWMQGDCRQRVLRGASWGRNDARSSARNVLLSWFRASDVGFRLALDAP